MANSPQLPNAGNRRLLDPSELGTREYWDEAYTRELHNHEGDANDEGTIWFSENGAEEAMLLQLQALVDQGLIERGTSTDGEVPSASRFLDLGTGNGHLLFALRDEDDDGECWHGELVGIDYSESTVKLAKQLATQKEVERVRFEEWDLLSDLPGDWLGPGFDVVLDKGTFDAISLMPHSERSQHPCETYRENVLPLIKPGKFLVVTSCNWTKEELMEWLSPNNELRYHAEAKYPTFTFGGQTGQSIVTLVLQKGV